MEAIEADHPGDNCEIAGVVVVVQVICQEDDEINLEVRTRAAHDMLPNAAIGLLDQAHRNLLMG
jgi:hypothetical protein